MDKELIINMMNTITDLSKTIPHKHVEKMKIFD